jgi:2-polyprenyl-3-methyl-5-hydroxy-6-metoxy-1,4-benzoquinol methylase
MHQHKHRSAAGHHCVCPWWLCFTFDNFLRRLVQNPERILRPYVKPGWTVLDVGPGIGYFTIPLARLVGAAGKVIAVDLQKEMLNGIRRRALKAGVLNRIELRQTTPDTIGINEPVDFCLAFWMVHEVPDQRRFLSEISAHLKPEALFLLVEPDLHVSRINYEKTLQLAKDTGLAVIEEPHIFISNSALLRKTSQHP